MSCCLHPQDPQQNEHREFSNFSPTSGTYKYCKPDFVFKQIAACRALQKQLTVLCLRSHSSNFEPWENRWPKIRFKIWTSHNSLSKTIIRTTYISFPLIEYENLDKRTTLLFRGIINPSIVRQYRIIDAKPGEHTTQTRNMLPLQWLPFGLHTNLLTQWKY